MYSNEPDSSVGSRENSCKCKTSTDLKIDWIWHLLLKIEAGVIGPTLLLALPYMANASLGFGFFFVSRSAEVRLRHKFTDWLQFPV